MGDIVPTTTPKAARLDELRRAVCDGPAALLRFQAMEAREEAARLLAVAAAKEAQAAEMEHDNAR